MSWEADFYQSDKIFAAAGETLEIYTWNIYRGPPGRFLAVDACPVSEQSFIEILAQWTDLTIDGVLRRSVRVQNIGKTDTIFILTFVVIPNE